MGRKIAEFQYPRMSGGKLNQLFGCPRLALVRRFDERAKLSNLLLVVVSLSHAPPLSSGQLEPRPFLLAAPFVQQFGCGDHCARPGERRTGPQKAIVRRRQSLLGCITGVTKAIACRY